jgi:hypothetical protein
MAFVDRRLQIARPFRVAEQRQLIDPPLQLLMNIAQWLVGRNEHDQARFDFRLAPGEQRL